MKWTLALFFLTAASQGLSQPTGCERIYLEDSTEADYFLFPQPAAQYGSLRPVLPEEDAGFRNLRRIIKHRRETGEYNFDGQPDYREQQPGDSSRWNYFIYRGPAMGYVKDTLLSSLDYCVFDFERKYFGGSRTVRVDSLITHRDGYEYRNGVVTLVRRQVCRQAFPHAEKTDCWLYEWEAGEWMLKRVIKGAE